MEAGGRVAPEYDNLIAKLMVWADSREMAVARLARALDEVEIVGIQTTIPFHRFVARSPAFRPEDLSTNWVADHWDGPVERSKAAAMAVPAAGLAVLAGQPAGPNRDGPLGTRGAGDVQASGRPADGAQDTVSRPSTVSDGWVQAARAEAMDRWPR